MSWYFPFSEDIKKNSVRYVLQRYLGHFFKESLHTNQLTVDLFKGIGSISNVSLNIKALNELAENQNLPLEFVDGCIEKITVSIPWSSLLKDSSSVEVDGLYLVIQPKQRADNGVSMFESTWSSMTSSIQLAEECLKNTPEQTPTEQSNPVNGVEEFATAIDSIITRTRIKFVNTVIRLEHLSKDSVMGGAIEVRVKQFMYCDETSSETVDDSPNKPAVAHGVKLFSAEGVELYTNEFYASDRTISRSLLSQSTTSSDSDTCETDVKRKRPIEELILFGKFMGKQEMRLKVKHKENASGPKIGLELNGSSLAIIASPRQLRTVCAILGGFVSPHSQDTSNVQNHTRCNQKPMTMSDFERVEHVLNQHLNPPDVNNFVAKSLQNTTGWSSGGVEEERDEDFHPVKGHYSNSMMSDSVPNSLRSSYSSSVHSYPFSSKSSEHFSYSLPKSHTTRHKNKSNGSESDFSGDIRRFELRLNLFTVVLLHRDILVSSDETRIPEESSVRKMQKVSEDFFAHFLQSNLNGSGREQPTVVLDKNHFRLHCSTVILNGEEKSNSSKYEVHGSLSVAKLELFEYLMELETKKEEIVELIRFINPADVVSNASTFTLPDVVVHFKCCNNAKGFVAHNRTELNVNMRHCCTEIDVTMIDRMVDILGNFHLLLAALDKSTDGEKPILSDVHAPVVDSKLTWKISSPFVRVKLRFPIPELGEGCNDEHWFWHRRNVLDDLLFVELSEITIQSEVFSSSLSAQSYECQTKSARVLFQESTAEKPVLFIFTEVDDRVGTSLPNRDVGLNWPKLVLRVCPKASYSELDDAEERLDASGRMAQSIIQTQKQEPSPFSAKMIKRESDTSHSDSTYDGDGEEIVLPGNKDEIGDFIETASHNALLQIEISLPSVVVSFPSKHFYELLYNRICNNLMLWVPRALVESLGFNSNQQPRNSNLNFSLGSSMFTSFSMCKSTVKIGSDSEDEDACESLLDGDVQENTPKQENNVTGLLQSKVTVILFVGQGVVDVFPNARDSTSNVIPEQYGEVQMMFQEANLFFVNGCRGKPSLNYVCLQINQCTLYHCSLIPECSENTMKPMDAYPSKHMLPTIYKTQAGAKVNENAKPVGTGCTISEDVLTLTVRLQAQDNRVKNICVANSLNGMTIRHRMKPTNTSWLSQLIDFFDVSDYPILHYKPWKAVTQLHQQFLNCVVDYRPRHLPLKAALAVEDFNMSSNITPKTPTSTLRFIAEEASLFLSYKVIEDERDNPHNLSIDLRSDYVCVAEIGLFELSLRLSDKDGEPQTDLRASNNIIHIRTCTDSAIAFMELVKYIAKDGDLCEAYIGDEYKMNRSNESGDDVLVDFQGDLADEILDTPYMTPGNEPEVGVSQLVEEAMMEEPYAEPPKKRSSHSRCDSTTNIELFYFPDEQNAFLASCAPPVSDSHSSDDDLENSFCYIEHEVGIGYLGKSSTPEVRFLTSEPIRMVDNHFTVPINKVDVLKAPKSYPQALSKYTLREMTIVWHMYGGNDFPKKGEDAKKNDTKKRVVIVPKKPASSESLQSSDSGRTVKKASTDSINISYSAPKSTEAPTVNFVLSPSPEYVFTDLTNTKKGALHERHKNSSWLAAGGVNRRHDELMELKLQKLKYQYEIYPKTTRQASRQVLIAQEVEISDRMATSQINKFLYQYSSSTRPKQSHANMVVVKATNIRPEVDVSHRQECCLRVSLLPLRLNIDQDSLLFLFNFLGEISGTKSEAANQMDVPASTTARQPVLNVENVKSSRPPGVKAEEVVQPPHAAAPANTPTFIRSFIFSQDVPIRLDYEGKRVDMKHGPLAGLLMGIGKLSRSELKLKKLCNRHGLLGYEKLLSYMFSEWLQDIKKNQLPSILGGVGPMYSLFQLFRGISDLFWLPIEQYQKDGRIVRGLQRGANSFTTSTAMAALELTARFIYAIQMIAEMAFDLVSPGPSIRYLRYCDRLGKTDPRKGKGRWHQKHNQPADIREGITSAIRVFKDGFEETAQNLLHVASIQNETKGAVGAVGGIIREMPSTALTPIILATQATSNVLDGVRGHLVPDVKTEAALKWKNDYFD